nr:transcriptional regulator [Agrobacterium sp. S2/73]
MLKQRRRHPRPLKVKKVQRSFTVEYRSGRRKLNPKPNSIWGDMDLKSVAQDLQDEAMPFLPETSEVSRTGTSFARKQQAAALLTPPIEQETNAWALQETTMADENDTMTDADTPAAAALDVVKKERKPRAKKAASETVSAAVSAQPAAASNAAAVKPKRGRKAAKSDEAATSAKRAPVKRATKAVQAATTPSVAAVDEFADLLQLEEENQRLRKLLAEKLRAENADLRKRLNLA